MGLIQLNRQPRRHFTKFAIMRNASLWGHVAWLASCRIKCCVDNMRRQAAGLFNVAPALLHLQNAADAALSDVRTHGQEDEIQSDARSNDR